MTLNFWAFIIFIIIISCSIVIFQANSLKSYEVFSEQARSFLLGQTTVSEGADTANINDKSYWVQGPFPSIILIPFILIFGAKFTQTTMQIILIPILAFLIFKLAKIKQFSFENSLYLTAVFLFGSVTLGLITNPGPYYYAQIVSLTLITAILLEIETKKGYLILGFLISGLLATRPQTAIIFFVITYFLSKDKINLESKINRLLQLFLPVITTSLLLMYFNWIRFGNPFDNGYGINDIGAHYGAFRDIGLFSIYHFPTNFYYYFLSSFKPIIGQLEKHLVFPYLTFDPWGISFFMVSPFFIYAFKTLKDMSVYIKSLWLIILVILSYSLLYYAPGYYQFGPRYTADFLPILFLLLLYSFKTPELTLKQKIFIISSCSLNTYLLITRFLLDYHYIYSYFPG